MENVVFAVFNFPGTTEEDLPLTAGERIEVLSRDDDFGDGWWEGRSLETGRVGLFPKIYTAEHMPSPSLIATSAASLQNESLSDLQPPLNGTEEFSAYEAAPIDLDRMLDPDSSYNAPDDALQDTHESESHAQSRHSAGSDAPDEAERPKSAGLPLDIEVWTPEQVSQHFAHLGFDLAQKFKEHEVSGHVLLAMHHADLREIDIVAFGKRFEVMREIDKLRSQQSTPHAENQSSEITSRQPLAPENPRPSYERTKVVDGVQHLRINTNTAKDMNSVASPIGHTTPALQIAGGIDVPRTAYSAMTSSPGSSPTKSHKKALSTSSLAFGNNGVDKHHSRAWSHDTIKTSSAIESDARRSDALGSVPELNGSVASTDSSSDLKSPSFASPSSAGQSHSSPRAGTSSSGLQQKRSILGRRQPKWRPNAVSENLEQLPVAEAVKAADFSGWLRKRSERNYQWNLRFFVLKGTRLAYYLTDEDTQERGIIDINAYKVQQVEDLLFYGPAKLTFKVVPPAPGASRSLNFTPPKTVYFNAESATLMREWMTAMTKATIGRDWSTPVISSCTTKTISLKAAQEQRRKPATVGLSGALEPVHDGVDDAEELEGAQGDRPGLQRQASGASLSSLRKAVMGAAT
ncbi:hypothetical protein BCR37DRAFT_62638 [Protomyces lactucae-debilis]|uniref:PH domain-containing protein n=1 Tax=Protomyces lactucae-debilis TaxID=2754530 RepID=A0A1Y2FAS7_PROLT|nr:uncharacterized protein BCR37DRAFT_62638 [Protomyces lactucae-debilis]ORY81032.1 hypothetical protein BCR37DRAFT_62638 [Protomyces lactucae-debilis]